jgi:hypothetical protein
MHAAYWHHLTFLITLTYYPHSTSQYRHIKFCHNINTNQATSPHYSQSHITSPTQHLQSIHTTFTQYHHYLTSHSFLLHTQASHIHSMAPQMSMTMPVCQSEAHLHEFSQNRPESGQSSKKWTKQPPKDKSTNP